MAEETGYPLRVRFADGEWAARLSDAARAIADRPAFAETTPEVLLSFCEGFVADKIGDYLSSSVTFDDDPAGWTGYTNDLIVDVCALCRDLTAAAYEHFLLPPSVRIGASVS